MQLIFYQTTFHDIDLINIAGELQHPLSEIANSSIYEAVYDQLKKKENFGITQEFIKQKLNLSNWIKEFIEKRYDLENIKILSVGCGTGLVEIPLIQLGCSVDLQECQENSIQYIKNYFPHILKKTNFILSKDLSKAKDQTYDCVIAITSTYPLNDGEMKIFLESINRVLKPGGHFLLYDNSYNLLHLIKSIYWSIRNTQHSGVRWGHKRSVQNWRNLIKNTGVEYQSHLYFDIDNKEVLSKKIFGLPIDNSIFWQMLVCRKDYQEH